MKQSFKASMCNGRLSMKLTAPTVSIGIQECFCMVVDKQERMALIAELQAMSDRMDSRMDPPSGQK